MRALADFGAPMEEILADDFAHAGVVYQIGLPPARIDILTELSGISFDEAWPHRLVRPFGEVDVPFIGRVEFVRNKRATGRAKDLGDLEGL